MFVFSFEDENGNSLDSSVFTYSSIDSTWSISSSDTQKATTYQVKLIAKYKGSQYTKTAELPFTVTVSDPCLDADLTVEEEILETTSIIYPIYKPADTQTLDLSKVISSSSIAACPLELYIMNSDESEIDSEVFTFVPETRVFTIDSHDIDHMDVYSLKVVAKYAGTKYTKVGELPFTVTVDDHCVDATLTIDPTILSSIPVNYFIDSSARIETFTQDKVSSTEGNCPEYLFTVEQLSGTVHEPHVFTYDAAASRMRVFSETPGQDGTYAMRLTVRYEGDPTHYTQFGSLDFDLNILIPPCDDVDLTIETDILTSTSIIYYIKDASDR